MDAPEPEQYASATPGSLVAACVVSLGAWRERLHACKGAVPAPQLPRYEQGLRHLREARAYLASIEDALWEADHPAAAE